MDDLDLELLVDFVAREERYLRLSETSFKQKELDEGRKRIKKVVLEVKKTINGSYSEIKGNDAKKDKIITSVYKKVSKICTKRAVKKIVDKYELFEKIFEKSAKTKVEETHPHKFDRFYVPRPHEYR
ncbi:Uncharacterised protein [uncultured archaeon]|nr:Uncharacterised protein [uncultured archaeon]